MSEDTEPDKDNNKGVKKTNDSPRYEPRYARNSHYSPPGALGNSDPSKPLTEEQKKAISKRQERAEQKRQWEQDRENARLGVRGEGRGPYFAKKAFDKSNGFDR